MEQSTHERFAREETISIGSERSFGLVMAVALALLGAVSWWNDGHLWPWLGIIAVFFLGFALFSPGALRPLNRLWFKFGMLLHAVVNPIIMGLIFYGAVLPTGLIMRAMGKDPLRLKRSPDSQSYWIVRQPPGPQPETMKDQF
jgi:hypothetical protein